VSDISLYLHHYNAALAFSSLLYLHHYRLSSQTAFPIGSNTGLPSSAWNAVSG
jgi:hypothetical protein